MRVLIRTFLPKLGYDLAADLEARGLGPVEVSVGETKQFSLRHRSSVPAGEVARLLDAIAPFLPEECSVEDDLGDVDVELKLGDEKKLDTYEVHRDTDTEPLGQKVKQVLDGLGFRDGGGSVSVRDHDQLLYAGASTFSWQLIAWHLRRLGIAVQGTKDPEFDEEEGTDEPSIYLSLRDPAEASKPLAQRYEVEVATDSYESGTLLVERLQAAGFRCKPVMLLEDSQAATKPLTLDPGPFGGSRAPAELAKLRTLIETLATEKKIDLTRFPLEVSAGGTGLVARIELPFKAITSGNRRAYAGPYPERFNVAIHTDDPAAVAGLRERLEKAGFRDIAITKVRSTLDEDPKAPDPEPAERGFVIHWGAAGKEQTVANALRDAVTTAMRAANATPALTLQTRDQFPVKDTRVVIFFPTRGVADGTLHARLTGPSGFRLEIFTTDLGGWDDLREEWKKWGLKGGEPRKADRAIKPEIVAHTSAPNDLVERIKASILDKAKATLATRRRADMPAGDIRLFLPDRSEKTKPSTPASEKPALDVHAWLSVAASLPTADGAGRHFVEILADRVRVGEIVLPRRQGAREAFVPDPAGFVHFCLDGRTAETLHHIATSVVLREPCLLEGETSTSKTSTVFYLAALLNQPVARINLNGQTDTGELVGRFVPQNLFGELPVPSEELAKHADLLETETRMILGHAQEEKRRLSVVEVQQIMANEGMRAHPWRWQDGLVVLAMKRGWWVLLDEVNLAEPQILERLNSVLEADPLLVLTENDNSCLGPGGDPVHPDFRIFATMNPAEYAGRSVLSPAYRDRWRGFRFVPRPGEQEYLAMLRLLVYGQHPDVSVLGRPYRGAPGPARYAALAALENVDALLQALARFQTALEHAAGQTDSGSARIGARRKERYVFTRRGLLSVLDYLASPLSTMSGPQRARSQREAILRYYLGRVSSPEDQAMVVQLLDAAGIGPHTWSVG